MKDKVDQLIPVEEKKNVKKPHQNRFNTLTSKEWLPFQKSWFRFDGKEKLYKENVRFFTSADKNLGTVYYYGPSVDVMQQVMNPLGHDVVTVDLDKCKKIQYALIDLLDQVNENTSIDQFQLIKKEIIQQVERVYEQLAERRFLTVFIPNIQSANNYFPFAWDLAKDISTIISLKDEKIACIESGLAKTNTDFFQPSNKHFYCLHFRKDEHSQGAFREKKVPFFSNNKQQVNGRQFQNDIASWFILKPQPRKKNEILHPAKYPESLVEMFIKEFTKEGDAVFDPMSGTGSTQMAALKLGRSGYGTELSSFFSEIANERCSELLKQKEFGDAGKETIACKIINKDARAVNEKDFQPFDYIITSPPYWDMLNMKGAENQAKRLEKGLQTNYSDSDKDLGNISDYNDFLQSLCEIYLSITRQLKPGGYITIVVKNIKKKGRNYPFAWDLCSELQKGLILLPEVFWCQDDISIAPYGYGNTWVSNTFHQYCLTFQKPIKSSP
ncbi:MAG TPA: DNA methyltransferase [Flavisolibacter sp.]|nr:DNA methyltransferase [Flavisolibacter sp.]